MKENQVRVKSPQMSYSTYLQEHGSPTVYQSQVQQKKNHFKHECSSCSGLKRQIEIRDQQIKQLMSSTSFQSQFILRDQENLKKQFKSLELESTTLIQGLQNQLTLMEQKNQELSITKGQQIVSLKNQLLQMENDSIQKGDLSFQKHAINALENKIEQLNNYLESQQYNQEQKFIKSVLHMVVICHPEEHFRETTPTLKQAWKWLKQILQDYVVLKKGNQNFDNEYHKTNSKRSY